MKAKEFITEAPRDVFHFVGQSHNVPKPTGSYYKWRVDLSDGQHYFVRAGAHVDLEKFEQYFARKWAAEMPGVEVIDAERLERLSEEGVAEGWSQKYKRSIDCSHPKGFSQKAHCAGKKKHNESVEMEMTCPDCGMCQTHGNLNEIKKGAKDSNGFTKCWSGYHAAGTKKGKNGKSVRNCVPNESVEEDWQKVNKHDKTDGMSGKAVKAYRRENPGSKLKTAVTTKPSKLKKGSKSAKRRKSFCARMSGMKRAHASAKTKRNPDSPINKALRRWNCESIEDMRNLIEHAEQIIAQEKK